MREEVNGTENEHWVAKRMERSYWNRKLKEIKGIEEIIKRNLRNRT